MKFAIDNRDNPGLHRLYVGYAYEDLTEMMQFVENMLAFSRVNAMLTASLIQQEIQRLVKEDAAYFEAAAMLYAHIPFEDENGKD